MRLEDNDPGPDNNNNSLIATVICILLIISVFTTVILLNKKDITHRIENSSNFAETATTVSAKVEKETSTSTGTLKPSDLDFYDLYPESDTNEPNEFVEKTPTETVPPVDITKDGKHTCIINDNGEEQWIPISPYLTKNKYDITNFLNRSGIMEYYENDRLASFWGVDISKEQAYVDFNKLQKSGCDFVMLFMGARGSKTGQLSLDEFFVDNLRRAKNAGLNIGIYFNSQAITPEEAVEEAEFVLENLNDINLIYPICFVMDEDEELGRTSELSKTDKALIADAFLEQIAQNGYKTAVAGTKKWLCTKLDLAKLITKYDFWLLDPDKDYPDYPYSYSMWRYTTHANADGIKGYVNMNICLTDYSMK